jgi:hypothetical protein
MALKKADAAIATLIFCLAGFMPAHGQSTYFSEANKTIAKLGAQGTSFYTYFAEPMGQNCLNGVLYISPDKKGLYTQLLAAKLTGKRISRVDYSQPAGNGTFCNVELVEIAD